MTKPTAATEGRRALHVKARDQAITDAAMKLANRRSWPSPAAIEQATGIDESIVERQRHLLKPARRRWVELNGAPHPQWTDPEVDQSVPPKPEEGPTQALDEEKENSHKGVIAKQKVTIRNLKSDNERLREQVRRLLLGVRPSELNDILEAGTPQHRLG